MSKLVLVVTLVPSEFDVCVICPSAVVRSVISLLHAVVRSSLHACVFLPIDWIKIYTCVSLKNSFQQ